MSDKICSGQKLKEAANLIAQQSIVAVDTEFHAERRYEPKLLLISVALSSGETFLFDPRDPETIAILQVSLLAPSWIAHGAHWDIVLLSKALHGTPSMVWDTQIMSGLIDVQYPCSLSTLCQAHLGKTIAKGETLSNWAKRPLSKEQLRYAVNDVTLLFDLHQVLITKLEQLDRVDLCQRGCKDAIKTATTPLNPDLAYQRVPALQALSQPEASLLQALCSWREKIAREKNLPIFGVVSDGALVSLSRSAPQSTDAMLQNRLMPKGVVNRHGAEIIETIQQALQRPSWSHPKFLSKHSVESEFAQWLDCFVLAKGRKHNFSHALLLPRSIRDLIAQTNDPEEVDGILDWRASLIAQPIKAALGYGASIAHTNKVLTTNL